MTTYWERSLIELDMLHRNVFCRIRLAHQGLLGRSLVRSVLVSLLMRFLRDSRLVGMLGRLLLHCAELYIPLILTWLYMIGLITLKLLLKLHCSGCSYYLILLMSHLLLMCLIRGLHLSSVKLLLLLLQVEELLLSRRLRGHLVVLQSA